MGVGVWEWEWECGSGSGRVGVGVWKWQRGKWELGETRFLRRKEENWGKEGRAKQREQTTVQRKHEETHLSPPVSSTAAPPQSR